MRGVIKILVLGMVVMVVAQPSYDERWEGNGTGHVVVNGDTIYPWFNWTAWVEYDYMPGKDTIWGIWWDNEGDTGRIYGHRDEANDSVFGTWDCINCDVSGEWKGKANYPTTDSAQGEWWVTSGGTGDGTWSGHREE